MISYISNNALAPNSLSHEDVEQLIRKNARIIDPQNQTYCLKSGYGKIDAGNTIKKMLLPKYQVKHYNATVSNSTAVLTGGNIGAAFNLNYPAKGLNFGTYTGDIYKVTTTFSLNLPSTATVLGVWVRNSASDLYAHSGELYPFSDIVITAQSSSAVTVEGYIYNLQQYINGASSTSLNEWLPFDLSGNSNFGITVYIYDPVATAVSNPVIESKCLGVYPNPANSQITLAMGLMRNSTLNISLCDMQGKVVYELPRKLYSEGHNEIPLPVANLPEGIYLCRLITENETITQKIIIAR